MNKCLECGKEILPKDDSSKAVYEAKRKKFCNRSCAAKYNNKKHPKRRPTNFCIDCGVKLSDTKSTRCTKCNSRYKLKLFEERSLKDVKIDGNARVAWSSLRQSANRKMGMNGIEKKCLVCGISEPVDCCHIKGIAEFPLDTKVSEVNSLDNLVYLCKNHHWMMDHGKLDINEFR